MKLHKRQKVQNFDFWPFLRFWQVEKSRSQEVFHCQEVKKSSVGEIRSSRTMQFSTSVELRPGNVSLLVRKQFFSKTALRIFLIFCMKVPDYKDMKTTRAFFEKNSGSFKILRKTVFFAGFLTISRKVVKIIFQKLQKW